MISIDIPLLVHAVLVIIPSIPPPASVRIHPIPSQTSPLTSPPPPPRPGLWSPVSASVSGPPSAPGECWTPWRRRRRDNSAGARPAPDDRWRRTAWNAEVPRTEATAVGVGVRKQVGGLKEQVPSWVGLPGTIVF